MKRTLLLGILSAGCALSLSLGLCACGEKSDGSASLVFEYDKTREAYAVTGFENFPTEEQAQADPSLVPASIEIPAEYRGKPVYIADSAFTIEKYKDLAIGLTTVTLQDGVLSIGQDAFAGCAALVSVSLPAGLTSIGGNAFAGCSSLVSAELPAGLTTIGEGAFANCALTGITIPASVTEVGEAAFSGCAALKTIAVDAQNTVYVAAGNILYNKAQTEIVHVPAALEGEVTLPQTVEAVGEGAFYGCSFVTKVTVSGGNAIGANAFSGCTALETISLPDGIIEIGAAAFSGCTALKEVHLPASARKIGAGAFENCDALTEIEIPDVPADHDSVPELGAWAFASCEKLATATLPASLTKIPDGLFAECGNLVSANIPEHVDEIGRFAFSDCVKLASVNIPASVRTIGERAFFGCGAVEEFTVADGNTAYHAQNGCLTEKATKTLLYGCDKAAIDLSAAEIEAIAPYAFRFMRGIQTVVLPTALKTLGSEAFFGCSALESIQIGQNEAFFAKDGVLYTSFLRNVYDSETKEFVDKTFYTFNVIPAAVGGTVEIPEGVEAIPANAFEYCEELEGVALPKGVRTIGSSAFAHCGKLASVTLCADLTVIGESAFAYCTSLTSFAVPDGTDGTTTDTTLSNYAFLGCTGLQTVEIGDHVTSISANAFEGCAALKSIAVSEKNARYASQDGILYSATVSGSGEAQKKECTGLIYVPVKVEGAIAIPEGVSSIAADAFYCRNEIVSVALSSSVSSIGDYAFANCEKLASVTLCKRLSSIGDYAFYGCTALSSAAYEGTKADWGKLTLGSGNDLLTAKLTYAPSASEEEE